MCDCCMLFEVQNYNTLCNPLVCPLSDRAVGKYENLEEGVMTLGRDFLIDGLDLGSTTGWLERVVSVHNST